MDALVFPGMGPTKFADLGRFLLLNPHARRLVAAADTRLGYPLADRFAEAEGDYSEYAQVAFFVACLALAEWAEAEHGVEPAACAGPSFGEKPAAVRAGSLSFEDGVWLTARLARCLEEYFAVEHRDVVTHSFARVPETRVRELVDELAGRGGWSEISCFIDRDLFMVSLRESELDWLQRSVRSLGGLSLYTMRPPMHASVFDGLRRKAAEEVIGELEFAAPLLPLLADQDGSVVEDGAGVRSMLLDSFVRPLRWPAVVGGLRELGVERVCVAGPDSLFGRVGCTTSAFEVVSATPWLAMQPRRRTSSAGR
ncbi:ACP S-malonyltransferase [Streptomyces sp. NBC_01451]|uniref:ACP S-malonyltransferase n=1 Tax=Streptomyces sp. NBC_01451 TaxID=2903872 RepID=UPI002E340A29|nr:ACP S-malonyltransferase [Streptomyces sp. NBC_01451]